MKTDFKHLIPLATQNGWFQRHEDRSVWVCCNCHEDKEFEEDDGCFCPAFDPDDAKYPLFLSGDGWEHGHTEDRPPNPLFVAAFLRHYGKQDQCQETTNTCGRSPSNRVGDTDPTTKSS